MPLRLDEYRQKRRFSATPEPRGGGRRARQFVVQLHHASHRHYDFRLEWNGVLKSWAIPKGPSFDPAVKRLAVEVEDHPVDYANFEGTIPEGNYGAGYVDVFDSGTWESESEISVGAALAGGELKFSLAGDILRGSWVLVRTRRDVKKPQWLLIKHRDAYAGTREADDFIDPKTDRPLPRALRRKTWDRQRSRSASRSRAKAKARAAPRS
jgi:bifunctional non-homologous end joining protein LigD